MNKLALILALILGVVVGWNRPQITPVASAQISSPAYASDFGPSGTTSVFPAAQYLVVVAPQRLGGGVIIYQVTDSPFAINGATNLVAVASGSMSGASVQLFVPGNDSQTFTLSESKP